MLETSVGMAGGNFGSQLANLLVALDIIRVGGVGQAGLRDRLQMLSPVEPASIHTIPYNHRVLLSEVSLLYRISVANQ